MEEKKKILLLLKGCPCSGKSTWANEFIKDNPNYVIINRDTIRYEIGEGKYTMDHEKEVTAKENQQISDAINENKNLIIDATNLNPKYLGRWDEISEKYDYEIKWKEFYVPFDEAMRRSEQRKAAGGLYIPRDVMVRFYNDYYPEEYAKYREERKAKKNQPKTVNHYRQEIDKTLPPCVICDIDGTIAWMQGRIAYVTKRVKEDKVDARVADLMSFFMGNGVHVIFLSGREDIGNCKEDTLEWLKEHLANKVTHFVCQMLF